MRPKSDADVAEATRAWGRMRLLVLAVKEARGSFQCEYEDAGDYETNSPGTAPCWKGAEWESDYTPTRPEEWCQQCLHRQRWHIVLTIVKRIHGGRLRRLQRVSVSRSTADTIKQAFIDGWDMAASGMPLVEALDYFKQHSEIRPHQTKSDAAIACGVKE